MRKLHYAVLLVVLIALPVAWFAIHHLTHDERAGRAQLLQLVMHMDEVIALSAPESLDEVDSFASTVGYKVMDCDKWVASCPSKEPLLNPLGGVIFRLKSIATSMRHAWENPPVAITSKESAGLMMDDLRVQCRQLKDMTLASMSGAP